MAITWSISLTPLSTKEMLKFEVSGYVRKAHSTLDQLINSKLYRVNNAVCQALDHQQASPEVKSLKNISKLR
jgi:hypothetical protein